MTVVLRHRLAAGGSGWQFEVPLSAVPVPAGPLPAVELGEPWDGVPGLGREEEVAGSVAGLWALSLTDSHSEAPLVLVHSEVAGWDSLSRLQAGWTRYFSGRGPFCKREKGRRMAPGNPWHPGPGRHRRAPHHRLPAVAAWPGAGHQPSCLPWRKGEKSRCSPPWPPKKITPGTNTLVRRGHSGV